MVVIWFGYIEDHGHESYVANVERSCTNQKTNEKLSALNLTYLDSRMICTSNRPLRAFSCSLTYAIRLTSYPYNSVKMYHVDVLFARSA